MLCCCCCSSTDYLRKAFCHCHMHTVSEWNFQLDREPIQVLYWTAIDFSCFRFFEWVMVAVLDEEFYFFPINVNEQDRKRSDARWKCLFHRCLTSFRSISRRRSFFSLSSCSSCQIFVWRRTGSTIRLYQQLAFELANILTAFTLDHTHQWIDRRTNVESTSS